MRRGEANAILFITRKFPPSVGGMQMACYGMSVGISEHLPLYRISWGRSQAFLPFFLPIAFLRASWILFKHPAIGVIHLGDGLLSPLGWCLRLLFRKPVVVTVYGLDITYSRWLYQKWVLPFVRLADRVVSISGCTLNECISRGVPLERCQVIPVGVFVTENIACQKDACRAELSRMAERDLSQAKLMLTVGRLIKRKGVADFIERVMPRLMDRNPDLYYLVVGVGPDSERILEAANQAGLSERVVLMGGVDDKTLQTVYRCSDVFLMPNIRVEGDMEGFGIVSLEACLAGLPVVAADVDGISDAITHGENGFLVDPSDIQGYVDILSELFENESLRTGFGEKARLHVAENFSWSSIADRYCQVFREVGNFTIEP